MAAVTASAAFTSLQENTNFCKIFFLLICLIVSECTEIDSNGYVAFCPCMGRFGNQADHFLGVLGFAHSLNRTLILPAWVEYRKHAEKSVQVPFDTYFKVGSLESFHRVITMEKFMKEFAPIIWPPEKRIVFCYSARGNDDCNAKEGNPFGPFWDTYNIDFVESAFYAPLHYDTHLPGMADKWNSRYPGSKFPVLAFVGAPASFPVQLENRHLHQYLKWSDTIEEKATKFIQQKLNNQRFIGIHLRNGVDWIKACEHLDQSPNLFAAPQCLGYRNEHGNATPEMCYPSLKTITSQLKKIIKKENATAVFVASDDNHMIQSLTKGLKKLKTNVLRLDVPDPHVDLAILGRSDHFIANCISSFSAFAVRERMVNGLPYSFWGFPSISRKIMRDEF